MTLLNPLALLFALSIGVVLLLHFRKPRKTHWVSNLQLWQQTEKDPLRRRSVFRIIRKNRLLILQILVLALIVLALARPLITFLSAQSGTWILVMDCSASMQTLEDGVTRFDRAREKALAIIEDIRDADQILLVQARPQMRLQTYTGSEKAALRRALDAMTVSHAAADVSRAVTTAAASVESACLMAVHVISDGTQSFSDLDPSLMGKIRPVRIGETGDNVAITSLSVRGNPFSAHDRQIFCEIHNFSDRTHTFPLEISMDAKVLEAETVRLDPGRNRVVIAEVPAGGNGIIRADIHAEDALETDNRAFAVLNPRPMSVLLGTSGNPFLENALRVNPRVALTVLGPEECTAEALGDNRDVVILDGFEPPELPPGNYFLIHPGSSRRGIRNLVSRRPEHPVMAFIDTAGFSVSRAGALNVSSMDTVLMEGNGIPVLTATESGRYRMVSLGFDIRDSDLPLTYAFPVLVSNILQWLDTGAVGPGNQITAGATLRLRLPLFNPEKDIEVLLPDGGTRKASLDAGVLNFGETEETGIYTVRQNGAGIRFAVNLFSESESNIRPAEALTDAERPYPDRTDAAGRGREAWRWLLLASLLFLALEWRQYLGAMR